MARELEQAADDLAREVEEAAENRLEETWDLEHAVPAWVPPDATMSLELTLSAERADALADLAEECGTDIPELILEAIDTLLERRQAPA